MHFVYQAKSVDATAPRAFSCFMLGFRQPLPCLQTCSHPCHQREKTRKIIATANYADLKETVEAFVNGGRQSSRLFYRVCWKISRTGEAAVDRERCPQNGVNDATPLVSINQNLSIISRSVSLEILQSETGTVSRQAFFFFCSFCSKSLRKVSQRTLFK